MQFVDMTLADIRGDPESMTLRRRPVFVYVDFDKIGSRGLAYLIDTTKCWVGDQFRGEMATIPRQIPRSVGQEQFILRFSGCHGQEEGQSGVYVSRSPAFYALKIPCRFYVISPNGDCKKYVGKKGDWIVSDGLVNKNYTHSEMSKRFIIDKDDGYNISDIKPSFQRDQFGIPIDHGLSNILEL